MDIVQFNLHHHIRVDHESDYQRLIRFMIGHAFTLVLGGGGAKGMVHLGVIKAILEHNITIDAIGGTSIGSGVGAAYALTLNYDNTLQYMNKLKLAAVKSVSWQHFTWPLISIFSSNPATKITHYLFENVCIENLLIPYFAISSNLSEKSELIHKEGLIWEAIRSSSALPGIFPPVVIDGQIHYDGGLLNNLPVDVMRNRIGKDNIIMAVSLTRTRKNVHYHFPPVLTLGNAIMQKFSKKFEIPPFLNTFLNALLLGSSNKEILNANNADILVRPQLEGFKSLEITDKLEQQLLQIGYNEANKALRRYFANIPDENAENII